MGVSDCAEPLGHDCFGVDVLVLKAMLRHAGETKQGAGQPFDLIDEIVVSNLAPCHCRRLTNDSPFGAAPDYRGG